MKTRIVPADDNGIEEAAELIRAGQVVAVPTETVYGLAADATNAEAVARIYAAKGRPSFNPLIVHVLDPAHAIAIGARPSPEAVGLMESFWPGPLTIVVPLCPSARLAQAVTAGLGTVAIRSSLHPVMRTLIERCGHPLAAPSANASGGISPTTADHVRTSLDGRVPLILDGGASEKGLESTIVKVVGKEVELLRPGPIDADQIAMLMKLRDDGERRERIEAPGQLPSHYAPSKPVRLDAISAEEGEWLIGFGDIAGHASLSRKADLVEAAARLFAMLHHADRQPIARIAVAPIPEQGLGIAINDRLRRAAAPR